jgi:hypothetical protein
MFLKLPESGMDLLIARGVRLMIGKRWIGVGIDYD